MIPPRWFLDRFRAVTDEIARWEPQSTPLNWDARALLRTERCGWTLRRSAKGSILLVVWDESAACVVLQPRGCKP